jgi:hypothetical protein
MKEKLASIISPITWSADKILFNTWFIPPVLLANLSLSPFGVSNLISGRGQEQRFDRMNKVDIESKTGEGGSPCIIGKEMVKLDGDVEGLQCW